MKDLRLKYSSPARPPIDIDINKIYTLREIQDGFNVNYNLIKQMFTPVDGKWVDKKKRKNINLDKMEENQLTEGE